MLTLSQPPTSVQDTLMPCQRVTLLQPTQVTLEFKTMKGHFTFKPT